jgi:hypothetical protein
MTSAPDGGPSADDRALDEMLGRLRPALYAELGVTDGEWSAAKVPPPEYRRARVGGTRLRRDGSIQLSRRDHQALLELATGRGDSDDPAWCARAAKAFDNLLTAHVQRLPVGSGSRASHFRGKVAAVEGAKAFGVMTAGSGVVTLLHPLTDPYLRAIYEMTRSAVDVVSQQAAAVMPDHPTGWQMGLLAAGAAVSSGVPAAVAATRMNPTLDRGVHAAWVRASGERLLDRLGVADRLPAGDVVPRPGGRGAAANEELAAEGMARRVAEMTGSDTRTVLNQLVQAPSVDRLRTAVGMVLDRSTLRDVPDGVRDRAVDEVYLGLNSDRSLGLAKGMRAIDDGVGAILEADQKAGGSGKLAEAFPAAQLSTIPGSAQAKQDQAMNAALSALPEAGRGSGSDGARPGRPAAGWSAGKSNDGRPGRTT